MNIKQLCQILDDFESDWIEDDIGGKFEDQQVNLPMYKFNGISSEFVGYDSDSITAFWDVTGLGLIIDAIFEIDDLTDYPEN